MRMHLQAKKSKKDLDAVIFAQRLFRTHLVRKEFKSFLEGETSLSGIEAVLHLLSHLSENAKIAGNGDRQSRSLESKSDYKLANAKSGNKSNKEEKRFIANSQIAPVSNQLNPLRERVLKCTASAHRNDMETNWEKRDPELEVKWIKFQKLRGFLKEKYPKQFKEITQSQIRVPKLMDLDQILSIHIK